MTALFVSHGSPMTALARDDYAAALRAFGAAHRPKAIVVVSAHWEARVPVRVTSAERHRLIYDFGGFPEELYRLTWPAPGQPGLAAEILELLRGQGIAAEADPERGLDHGAWVPLRLAYPEAGVPVVQVSLPVPREPASLMRMGRALAPLRTRGVLLVGSGGVVHNLRRVVFDDEHAPVVDWARSFDEWVAGRVLAGEFDRVAAYAEVPGAELAVPTTEHFDPVFVVLGAAADGERARTVYEGFRHGTLSMRCFSIQ
jgi:4,5-DOPA dioxygenase extradiol